MATVLDKASPIQQRTDPSEDLRLIISRAFLMAQAAANAGGSVAVDVWEESGDASKNPWAKIGQISVNFARVPSLLLRAPIESTTTVLALGNGKPAAGAPGHVACPYCDGVMALKEDVGPGIRYDYTCTSCGWEASYSPSQAAEWLRKFPIRSDGGRLAAPTFDEYDKPKSVTALASFRSGRNLALLIHIVKSYGESLKVYSGKDGKEMGDGIRCRTPENRAMALAMAKRFLEDKEDVEIHDQALDNVQPMNLWATPPATKTTLEDLKEILEKNTSYMHLITTSGKTIETHRPGLTEAEESLTAYSMKTPLPLAELAQLRVNGEASKYGNNVKIVLWQNPDWDPSAKPGKNGKGKKGVFPPAPTNRDLVALGQRISILEGWSDFYADDDDSSDTAAELGDKTYSRIEALRTFSEGGDVPDGIPADDEDLLDAWRAIYPERALGATLRAMQPETAGAR